jgi:hypothetical protein
MQKSFFLVILKNLCTASEPVRKAKATVIRKKRRKSAKASAPSQVNQLVENDPFFRVSISLGEIFTRTLLDGLHPGRDHIQAAMDPEQVILRPGQLRILVPKCRMKVQSRGPSLQRSLNPCSSARRIPVRTSTRASSRPRNTPSATCTHPNPQWQIGQSSILMA